MFSCATVYNCIPVLFNDVLSNTMIIDTFIKDRDVDLVIREYISLN